MNKRVFSANVFGNKTKILLYFELIDDDNNLNTIKKSDRNNNIKSIKISKVERNICSSHGICSTQNLSSRSYYNTETLFSSNI